jgi:hypothetical protein
MFKTFLVASCLALSACASVPANVGNYVPITSDSTTNVKRLYEVETAYNIAASSYLTLVDKGLLTGQPKATVKSYLLEASGKLKLARASMSTTSPSVIDNINLAFALIGKANTLMPQTN